MIAKASFRLTGIDLPETADLLGLWELSPPAAASFGSGKYPGPTWQITLPGDPQIAQAILRTRRDMLIATESDLQTAARRLATLPQGDSLSFAAASGPEEVLLAEMAALDGRVDFAPGSTTAAEMAASLSRWQLFMDQIRSLVSHYARIETIAGGRQVGRTAVGWTGDSQNIWADWADHQTMSRHLESVALALGSRLALIRMVTLISTAAARLALRLVVPGAQLLLLPAIWQFIRTVLAELRRSWPIIQNARTREYPI